MKDIKIIYVKNLWLRYFSRPIFKIEYKKYNKKSRYCTFFSFSTNKYSIADLNLPCKIIMCEKCGYSTMLFDLSYNHDRLKQQMTWNYICSRLFATLVLNSSRPDPGGEDKIDLNFYFPLLCPSKGFMKA